MCAGGGWTTCWPRLLWRYQRLRQPAWSAILGRYPISNHSAAGDAWRDAGYLGADSYPVATAVSLASPASLSDAADWRHDMLVATGLLVVALAVIGPLDQR